MRILTNDYLSNLPGSAIATKGGPPLFARNFSDIVVGNGHEWIGIVTSSSAPLEGYEEVAVDAKRRFFTIQVPREQRDFLRDASVARIAPADFEKDISRIGSIIAAARPDLLFLNGFSLDAWTYAAAAFRAKLPVVIQHAGILTKEFEMYRDWFSPAAYAFAKEAEGDVAERAAANIFLNEFSRDAFVRLVEPESLANPVVIPLPQAAWPREAVKTPQGTERTLGIVARWDRIKNHEAVLALAEELQRRALPWRIRSVTAIPETQSQAGLKRKYRSLIDVVPPMDRDDLRAFYASLDALILPSHFDVSPTVVMEGVALGKPTLISPHVGWVSEYEACGMGRWIADFSDPSEVIARLEEQFARSAWPEVDAFASYVAEHHDAAAVYGQYLSVFEQMIS